jgi:ketosteroid isomerase-like protein
MEGDTGRAVSRGNTEVVREQFEATNRSDFAAPMADWDGDIELVVEPGAVGGHGGPSTLALTAGRYAGREAVGEYFGDWFRTFRPVHFELVKMRAAGDAVAVAAFHRARGRQSGIELSDHVFYEYRLRDGKIVRITIHDTWSKALEAVGLRE